MSNKNKISILFETLGIDKAIKSLQELASRFLHLEKTTKKTTEAAYTIINYN